MRRKLLAEERFGIKYILITAAVNFSSLPVVILFKFLLLHLDEPYVAMDVLFHFSKSQMVSEAAPMLLQLHSSSVCASAPWLGREVQGLLPFVLVREHSGPRADYPWCGEFCVCLLDMVLPIRPVCVPQLVDSCLWLVALITFQEELLRNCIRRSSPWDDLSKGRIQLEWWSI